MSAHNENKLIDYGLRPITTGVVAYIAARSMGKMMGMKPGSAKLFGKNINKSVAFGSAVGLATLGAEIANDYGVDKLTDSERIQELSDVILGPVIAGSALVGLGYAYNGKLMYQNLLLGAGVEFASQYSFPILTDMVLPSSKLVEDDDDEE